MSDFEGMSTAIGTGTKARSGYIAAARAASS